MKKKSIALLGLMMCLVSGCADKKMDECLFPRAEESYVGDVMALSSDDGVYLNYLYETDNNGVGYHPLHQFYTKDFLKFRDNGETLKFAENSELQDLAIGTGSFIKDDSGKYHCFYTGHNDYYDVYGLDKECVMHATSKDNKKYEKNYEEIIHAPNGYSTTDFRDPQVYHTDDGYIMLVGARKEAEQESAIIYYESQDLSNWTFKGDFYTSKELYFMECPDVFKLGEKYYLVFSWNNVVYYRMADSFFGPWEKPEIDTFDGNGFYAAKTCEYKDKRYLIGFLDRKKRENDSLGYTWAGSVLVYELRQLQDGTLGVCMPEQYNGYFDKELKSLSAEDESMDLGKVPETCHLSFELTMQEGGACSLDFSNPDSGEEYKISIDNEKDIISYNAFPNFQPVKLETGEKYQIDVVIEKDIVVVYAGGVKALSNRIYSAVGGDWKLNIQGAEAKNVKIYGK
ncbi:hypothetical protein [Butyrivibrio sp. JL13D10]|uniref:hypothetical protein n=1 Tax=Butyrivibrio sp. JL13D10 TaxID=3236815 RepID=UPI0038B5123B